MKDRFLTVVLLLCGAISLSIGAVSCWAQEAKIAPLSQSDRARLSQLQARLQPLLKFGEETVPLQWEGDALVARFHPREFVVYAEKWGGEYETQSHIEQGPQRDGLILRIELKSGQSQGNQMRPLESRGPYWLLWQDAVPLNIVNAEFKAPVLPPGQTQTTEYPDVPRGHWAYQAINQLRDAGVVEGLPSGNYSGNKSMTRYEFAVALARAGEKWGFNDGREIFPSHIRLGETRPLDATSYAALKALRREFAADLIRLGIKPPPDLPYYRFEPNLLSQHLSVEMRYNDSTNDMMKEQLKRAINEWAVEDTRQQLQISKEDK